MSLSLSNLQPAHGSRHRVKRIGRGNASGHGTTATRGTKGQRARQGGRKGLIQLGAKHFVSHLPKVRGFRSLNVAHETVDVIDLTKFSAETVVTPKLLANARLISRPNVTVKLIGSGKVPHKLSVQVHSISTGARKAIESAGGEVTIIAEKVSPTKPKR